MGTITVNASSFAFVLSSEGIPSTVSIFWEEAVSIAITQDKRESRFLMRYRCVDDKLAVHNGILVHAREVLDGRAAWLPFERSG